MLALVMLEQYDEGKKDGALDDTEFKKLSQENFKHKVWDPAKWKALSGGDQVVTFDEFFPWFQGIAE
jgi:hypothetical protein